MRALTPLRSLVLPPLLLLALIMPAHGQAVTPATLPPLTAQQARQVLDVLRNPARRAEFATTLESFLNASRAVAPGAAAGAPVTGAKAPPAKTGAKAPPPGVQLVPDSLMGALLLRGSGWLSRLSGQLTESVRAMMSLPLLWAWLEQFTHDPAARAQTVDAVWKAAVVMAAGLAAEFVLVRLLRGLRRALAARAPGSNGESDLASEPEETELPANPAASDLPGGDAAPAPAAALAEDAPGLSVVGEDPVPLLAGDIPGVTMVARPRRRRLRAGWALLRRLPLVFGRLLLDLLPVVAFLAVGNGLVGTPLGTPITSRLVILAVVQAYALTRATMCVLRAILDPSSPRLRLVGVSDRSAAYLVRWAGRIVAVSVFGVAAADVAALLGLYGPAHDALIKLVALAVHLFLVVIVLQTRQRVAAWIRPGPGSSFVWASVRLRFAAVWHWVAIFYIVALWFVWAIEVRNGFVKLVHFFAVSVGVLVAARLLAVVALGALDRLLRVPPELQARFPGLQLRAGRYQPALRAAVSGLISLLAALGLLQVWGLDAFGWLGSTPIGGQVVSACLTIAITLALALAAWEFANAAMERSVDRLQRENHAGRAVRVRTLLPILRSSLLITILVIVALTVLSEIGVNIAPLLAGAGVVGVAIGFGSQSLVKDLITGLFLLLENTVQVGDWVTLAGLSGSVEQLSIRTIRLRAGDGSLHIIPFSAVTTVTNTNRGRGNAAVAVSVAFDQDTDRVGEALSQIAIEMRADPAYKDAMLSDLQLWGVDKVDGFTATLVGQIACTDTGRWAVQREFNRRMKKRFQELDIRMVNPSQTMVLHGAIDRPLAAPEEQGRPAAAAP